MSGKLVVIIFVVILIIIGVVVMLIPGTLPTPGPDERTVAENNRAVGHMGRYEYTDAHDLFAQILARNPEMDQAKVNLAIATLNRQQDGDEQAALDMLAEVLVSDPENLQALYCSGLLQLYLGEPEVAMEAFRTVAQNDPTDAYAAYYVGQCLAQLRQPEEAIEWYERAIILDPYLRSAYYGAQQVLQRLGRRDEAETMLELFKRLDDNPRARLVEFVYTKMGPKGEVVAFDVARPKPAARPQGAVFADPHDLLERQINWSDGEAPASVTAVDLDGDGDLDLFFADNRSTNAVCLNDGNGKFTLDTQHVLASVDSVRAPLWGDIDNDGLVDVYLCRKGPNQLWRQAQVGVWADVTVESGTANGDLDTVDGMIFDADHDGDLDVFCVNADGPNELLSNNLDGTFRVLAADRGLSGGDRPSRQVVVTDLDRDRDADLLIIHAAPPHEVFINDRLWKYHPGDGFEALQEAQISAAVAADVNANGAVEIYTLDGADGAVQRWGPNDSGRWQAAPLHAFGAASHPRLALADVNGDGQHDLLATSPEGWRCRSMDGEEIAGGSAQDILGWAPINLDAQHGPSIVALTGKGPRVWPPGPGRYAFVALSFTGKEDDGDSMRSNASGIGVFVKARVDSNWTVHRTFRDDSGPGQSLQPIAIGLGGQDFVDLVALEWSDGVFQSEIGLDGSKSHRIEETQRQLSSCPVLFVWNGEKYEFVSDILGVGGMGFSVGPGEYAPSRPHEDFLLPEGLPVAREGRYVLKIGEPMEEACYLDAAALKAVDLPQGWKMTIDERMGIEGPEPTGEMRFYRHEVLPVSATNDRGQDVTADVVVADLRAASPGPIDERFIGRLERPYTLTLVFDEPLDARQGQPMLIADGWLEYPYSQTMFAAWQAGAEYLAPTLETATDDGEWQVLYERFGYPAGMPRQMSIALNDLPEDTTRLRLTTTQEIYWDRIAVAWAEPCPEAQVALLDLAAARVLRSGFARRTTADQRLPYYDYDDRLAQWDTRYQEGMYTRFGPVEPLVSQVDDALAVIGPGEEVHLEFVAPDQPLSSGWTRRFVFRSDGWCKDMDLYTRDGDTVGPLPDTGKPAEVRDRLHQAYNTRFQTGR